MQGREPGNIGSPGRRDQTPPSREEEMTLDSDAEVQGGRSRSNLILSKSKKHQQKRKGHRSHDT